MDWPQLPPILYVLVVFVAGYLALRALALPFWTTLVFLASLAILELAWRVYQGHGAAGTARHVLVYLAIALVLCMDYWRRTRRVP